MSAPAAEYYRIHSKIRRERGPASAEICPCAQPAADWAYDKSGVAETTVQLYDGRTVTFSTDVGRYVALCKACHHALDHPPKTVCKRGHDLLAGDVYVRPNGRRQCRACRVQVLQEWRESHPNWRERTSA